jgi:hypothetical protein
VAIWAVFGQKACEIAHGVFAVNVHLSCFVSGGYLLSLVVFLAQNGGFLGSGLGWQVI